MKVAWLILSVALLQLNWCLAAPQGNAVVDENTNSDVKSSEVTENNSESNAEEPNNETPIPDPAIETKEEPNPVVDKPPEPPVTDKPTEPPVTDKPTEPPVTDKPTEAPVTDKPTDPPVTDKPPTEPPVTKEPGWISKGIGKISNIIKGQGKLAKDVVGIIGNSMNMGNEIGKNAGLLGTQLGGKALEGAMKISSLGIDNSASLIKDTVGVVKELGKAILSDSMGNKVDSLTDTGFKGIDTIKGASKDVLGKVGSITSDGLKWISGMIGKGSKMTQDIVQKGTEKIQSGIDVGTKAVTNILDG